jgi:hypothetical protein
MVRIRPSNVKKIRLERIVCTENLNSHTMVMKPAEDSV